MKLWQRIRVVLQHHTNPSDSIRHQQNASSTTSFMVDFHELLHPQFSTEPHRNRQAGPQTSSLQRPTVSSRPRRPHPRHPRDSIPNCSLLKDSPTARHPRLPRGGDTPTHVQQTPDYPRQPSYSFRLVPSAWSTPFPLPASAIFGRSQPPNDST